MVEPDNQKVYFASDENFDDLFPDAENSYDAFLDALEGEQSYLSVNGETLPLGYLHDADAFIVEDNDISSDARKKAKILMSMFVKGELFDIGDIEKENGFLPDADYPMSVNLADGMTYSMNSYFPSLQQVGNVKVNIWSGSGYSLESLYVWCPNGAKDAQGALEMAVALAEKIAPNLLHDVDEVQDEMAADGHYDKETGEGDAIFDETYTYVDATVAGADCPYYVYTANLGVFANDGPLS